MINLRKYKLTKCNLKGQTIDIKCTRSNQFRFSIYIRNSSENENSCERSRYRSFVLYRGALAARDIYVFRRLERDLHPNFILLRSFRRQERDNRMSLSFSLYLYTNGQQRRRLHSAIIETSRSRWCAIDGINQMLNG